MKKYTTLVGWALLLGVWSGLSVVAQIHAQSTTLGGRIDAFTFFIPFPADILDDQFEVALSNPPPSRPPSLIDVDIETIISIALDREGSIIYYDHWEDGLESNLTQPIQPTTQIWGDNNPANGIPPGFSTDLLAIPATPQDDVITLRNIVVLPRVPATLFYDGGDVLTSVGGAVAVSFTFWTDAPGPGILFMDAWELYPTNRWGTEYRIPIGEDLAGTGPNQRPAFDVVGFNIQALEDGTNVEIDLDADSSFETTATLNQGESFNHLGDEGVLPTGNSMVVGATIRASAPVQVHLIYANPQSRYEMRGATIVPINQWTNDYVAPRSSDGDFWLYNPHGSDLQVTVVTSITAPTTIIIPPNTTVKYPPVLTTAATGVRFTSTDERPFYAVAAFDEADLQDWDHALLPFNRLATQTLIGLGLGNNNGPPPDGDESPVYVTAVDPTTVFVDYNNDGIEDASFPVAPLEEVAITDPSDFDMTGAFLYTQDQTPFAAVWGQRFDAPDALPSIDAGTGIVPLPSLLLQKTFFPEVDADCTGTVTLGDTVEFKLQHFNNTVNPIRNVIISDALPSALTYVPNSTQFNNTPLADGSSGTPFPLDEGGYNVGDIPPFGAGFITFDVLINDDSGTIINRADARSEDLPLGSDFVIVFTTAEAMPPLMAVNKTLIDPADGLVVSGQTLTFNLAITNTGTDTIIRLPLQDTFNEEHLTFLNAALPPDITASGVITWNDLTIPLGDLLPGAAINTTASFVVDQVPSTITNTLNTLTVVEAQRSNSPTPLTCRDQALVRIPGPAIHVKKATNGFDADDPNADPVPQIKPGDQVTWDYAVTNIGEVPLSNVTLVDDQLALLGVTPTFIGGDTNNDARLDLNEVWTYRATGVAEDLPNSNRPRGQCGPGGSVSPIYTNMATTTGQFGPTTVTDNDPSHYCPPPDEGCEGDCDPPETVTPPPPPPSPPPVTSAPPFPVAFLPETGTKETFQGGQAVVGVTLLVVALMLLSVALLHMGSRVKDRTQQRK